MPAKKNKTNKTFPSKQARAYPMLALGLFTLGILLLVALWDYTPGQSSQVTTQPTANVVGAFGAVTSFWSLHWWGLAAWTLPMLLLWVSYKYAFKQAAILTRWRYCLVATWFLATTGLLATSQAHLFSQALAHSNYFSSGLGGIVGQTLSERMLTPLLGVFGSSFLLIVLWATLFILNFWPESSPYAWVTQFAGKSRDAYQNFYQHAQNRLALLKAARAAKALEKKAPLQTETEVSEISEVTQPREVFVAEEALEAPVPEPTPLPAQPKVEVKDDGAGAVKVIAGEEIEKAAKPLLSKRGDYTFPPLEILSEAEGNSSLGIEDHQETALTLVQTLKEFGIEVTPGEVHTGPVITRYEVTPAPGVRVEKIINLDKNIALALKAAAVRIMAPVPGKGCVGIEVPNRQPSQVCLREIIESKAWAESGSEIPVVLGKEVTGKPIVADLTRMPHLLIAGSTGAGKTVCINAIIASLLYHASPEDLRFMMIDPKIVEMQVYNSLPHMLIPVVTDPKKVPGALKWLIKEMEDRYQIFAKVGVRNIAGFNAKILKNREEKAKADELDAELSPEERAAVHTIEVPRDHEIEIPTNKMPYIVCVIDELADLMMVAPADIETCVARLAQLARAAGIHLIIATQRPSVNVITGVIKANLPSRIAFKVASKVDSRTILDSGGADTLIGRGDMLFLPPGSAHQVRAQGAFVSDDEINGIVEFLGANGGPEFDAQIEQHINSDGDSGSGVGGDWEDDLIPEALKIIESTKKASASFLQRRLRVGYNRAARMMEILEDAGYVGPENGSAPREVFIDNFR